MKVSVIIPTYNGAHKLPGLMQSLQRQTYSGFETIVVVDGSTDDTIKTLNTVKAAFSSFKIIEQENKGRAAVRNRGAAEAGGDLLLFFDDDMLLSDNCIKKHIEHHESYPNSILTGGLEEPEKEKPSDFDMFKVHLNKKWTKPFGHKGSIPIPIDNPYLTAGNLSLSSALFHKLNGFDERLTDAEDYDLAIRSVRDNIPLFYNAEAYAWHNEDVSCLTYVKRLRQYATAQEKLVKLKPSLYSNSIRRPQPPDGLKGMVFKQLCAKRWIQYIDAGTLKWLPQPVRFKLYDMIVTANGSFFPDKVLL